MEPTARLVHSPAQKMNPHRTRSTALAVLAASFYALAAPSAAHATTPIQVTARGSNRLLVDGLLRDWQRFASFSPIEGAGDVVSGRNNWNNNADASLTFSMVHDEQSLYLAFEVRDDTVVR